MFRPQLARQAHRHDASRLEHVVQKLGGERRGNLSHAAHGDDHPVAFPARDTGTDRPGPWKAADKDVRLLLERGKNRHRTQCEWSG
jgi:hypothetical protein